MLIINRAYHRCLFGNSSAEKRNSATCIHTGMHRRNLSSESKKESTQKTTTSNQNREATNMQTFCLSRRNLICVSGSDSVNFLQGLLTNDMNLFQTENRKTLYAMVLNVQGRVLYDLIIYVVPTQAEGENCFYLECDTNVSTDIIKYFKRYKIRKKVTVTDLKGEYKSWASLCSPQQLQNSLSQEESDQILLCDHDPRVPMFCSRLILPHDTTIFRSGSEHDYHVRRYQLGIGEGIEDHPPGNCYPLECNLHFNNGVSFNKGCYLGQELTARTHHTGVIRKRLMPIVFESIPEGLISGDKITDINGKNVGKFRSSEDIYGLALLRVGQALKANESGMHVKDYNVKTQIPMWWAKQEI